MEKYFCNYNQSLALKELGFNERTSHYFENGKFKLHPEISGWGFNSSFTTCVSAPLKSQVFEWFRKEHQLFGAVLCDLCWNISGSVANSYGDTYDWDSEKFKTYEEAESDCIDKLIEIIKNE